MTSHFQETESALHAHSLRLTVVRWLTVLLCLCPWPFPASLNVHQTWIPQAMAVTPDTGPQLVSQEIRYHKPEAGEVWLVWGINGWHPVPESTRPASTVVEKGIMYTPMVDKGETFSIKLTVPTGAAINFGFQIRKNRQGTPISWVWDGNYASSRSKDGWTDLESRIGAVTAEQRKAWLAGQVSDLPLITREIRYRLPEAGEVWLVWGIDGWQALPSSVRPIGTVLKDDKLMHTRMTRTGDTFVSTVRFPSGAGFDYKFLITKTKDGTAVNVEDVAESRSPSTTIRMNSSATIESPQVGATALERKAWLAGQASDLPLVTREIRYQLPEAGEVWLVWGIDGWQPIPDAARPSGTAMRNGKMYTAMVRQGQTLAATVRLPPGAVMNYEFVIHTAAGPQSSGKQPWTAVTSLDSRVEVESSLTKAALEQRKTWPSGPLDRLSLVTQEIRFRIAGAEEVWLVWGINGLQPIPGEARPPGTVLKEDQVMRTPMNRKGDMFAATVRVPPQTVLDYKFLVTKTVGGNPADTWQDHDGKDFWKLVRTSGSSEHIATVTVVTAEQRQAWLAGRITGIPLVTQEIQYRAPGALEVWLLWGMDGWKAAPEAARPPGTLFRNAVMQSRMVYSGDTFTAKVRVPPGAVLDYGFLIVKTADGKTVDILENKNKEGEAFTNVAMFDGVTQVKSAAWLSSRASGLSTVAQELRYRIAGAGEVWLVWGINGWQPVPEEARPKGTVLKERVMHSPMIRNGDRFATTVLVPANTIVNYKFLVTKNSREAPLNLLDDLNGQAFQKMVRSSGSLEEHATVTVVTPEQRQAWLAGQLTDLPLVTQEIRYHAPGAEDVWLVWGLDGWQAPPEGARPVGTVIKEKVLRSRMVRKGDSFTATVQVPPGTGLDFWFHIAGSDRGRLVESRQDKDENGRTLSRIVMVDGQIQVRSH